MIDEYVHTRSMSMLYILEKRQAEREGKNEYIWRNDGMMSVVKSRVEAEQ